MGPKSTNSRILYYGKTAPAVTYFGITFKNYPLFQKKMFFILKLKFEANELAKNYKN